MIIYHINISYKHIISYKQIIIMPAPPFPGRRRRQTVGGGEQGVHVLVNIYIYNVYIYIYMYIYIYRERERERQI